MGLSASQARLLSLFGRRSDTEHQVQQTNNKRSILANLTAEAARQYSDSLGNRSFKYRKDPLDGNSSEYLDYKGLNLSNAYADNAGTNTSYTFQYQGQTVTRAELEKLSPAVVYDLLKTDDFKIQKNVNGVISDADKPNTDEMPEGLYLGDDASSTAKYQTKTAEYQAQDKMLENEIKNLDTQHQTIQTEIDAVKKVIDKDIEMTFKTFA